MAARARDNRFENALLETIGHRPASSCPEFEKLFGFALPPRVLSFSKALGDADFFPYPSTQARPEPWSRWRSLSAKGEKALSFFLSDVHIYGLLLGLFPFAKYKSDVHFVDVGDPEGHGEVFLHNHEVGLLEACSRTLGDWVQEVYGESEETASLHAKVAKSGKAPKSSSTRVRTVLEQYRDAYWIVEIFRGQFQQWPKREKPRRDPKLPEPFATNYELLLSSLCGDPERALRAVSAGRKSAALLTRTLAEAVDRNFARPKSARLGRFNADRLHRELPRRYGAGSDATLAVGEPEPISAGKLKEIAPLAGMPMNDPKSYWIVRMPLGSDLARGGYPKTGIEDFRFHEGEKLAKEFPPKTSVTLADDPSVKGKAPDFLVNSADLLIVSYRIRQILEALKAADLEFLPLIVKDESGKTLSERYFILNPLAGHPIVDLEKSRAQMDKYFKGEFRRFEKLRLDPKSLRSTAKLFREARNPGMIFAHECVRKAFRHCGVKEGWRYHKAQGWDGVDL